MHISTSFLSLNAGALASCPVIEHDEFQQSPCLFFPKCGKRLLSMGSVPTVFRVWCGYGYQNALSFRMTEDLPKQARGCCSYPVSVSSPNLTITLTPSSALFSHACFSGFFVVCLTQKNLYTVLFFHLILRLQSCLHSGSLRFNQYFRKIQKVEDEKLLYVWSYKCSSFLMLLKYTCIFSFILSTHHRAVHCIKAINVS